MSRVRPPEHLVYRRARERALTRLAQAYPNLYQKFLEEEKANDAKNKGNGSGITRTATAHVGIRTTTTASATARTRNGGKNKSNRRRKA